MTPERRSPTWAPFVAMSMLCLAAGVQIVQGLFVNHHMGRFEKSYWALSYEHGLVRRGLLGEILRRLSGARAAESVVVVAQAIMTATVIVLLLWLVLRLVATGEPIAQCIAVLLICTPFALDYLVDGMRPDLLGVIVMLAAGLALARFPGREVLIGLLASLALVIAIAAHEVNGLQLLPWLVMLFAGVMTLRGASLRTASAVVLAIVVPAALTMALVATAGNIEPQVLDRLERDAALEGFPTGDGTIFPYMSEDAVDALDTLSALGKERIAATGLSSLLAVILVFAAVALSRLRNQYGRIAAGRTSLKWVGVVTLVTVPFWLVQYATAYDWQRWTNAYLCYGLIVAGAIVLAARTGQGPATDRAASWSWATLPSLLVFAYLVALRPMPGWFDTIGDSVDFFAPM